MGRLLFIVLVNLGSFLVLRQLWPSIREGWRRQVFLGLSGLSVLAFALPLTLGFGEHGVLPVVGMPLKLFSSGWVVAVGLVMLLGWPLALLRSRSARAQARLVPALQSGQEGSALVAAAPVVEVDMERRSLLTGVGRALPLLAAGTSSAGIVAGSSGFEVRQVEVRLRSLPRALDGFRIGQITDIHVGAFIDAAYVRATVEAMNKAQVDLQVMTGDLIDDLTQLDETMAALETCQAPHGMLAILGNHEHWRGIHPIREAYAASERRGSPVRLLVDEAHVLEHAGQRVRVVGVDYPMGRGRGMSAKADRMRRSAEVAFRGTSADEVVLCLTHHPDFFPFALERGARLTLAGHTHGGQVAILGMPLFRFAFDYMLGRYRRGDGQLYVSGGTGHWLPFRLGVPAEVSIFTLRADT
ncbi:metallophosphoesterase [Vitiosangium sp. GDMCC 1.1324]|uniref:metallophosphoesterase n=1 Tax=Vitiosangium sp. (strain GDMCC 1.1324) TaxID=2138576 RepID=UPI000D3C37EC|nr:metallophosphoesterase [Vitiosangium sp. GDMCC 1.1324]PTL80642.1 metallophosphatase [Vitiosangium sp. GDMCC 1.1324]